MSETIAREVKTIEAPLRIPRQGGPNVTLDMVISFVRTPATATSPVRYDFVNPRRKDGQPLIQEDWTFLTEWTALNGDRFRSAI